MKERRPRLRGLHDWLPLAVVGVVAAVSWAVFLGGGLRSVLGWLALQLAVPLFALVLFLFTLVRTIRTRRGLARLLATIVISVVGLWPAAWLVGFGTIAYPYDLAKTTPSATVRLPTDVPMHVIWGGDDVKHNHHATLPDQRWAYDLAVEPTLVSSTRLEDYGCWGVSVVAPTSGKVHVAHDGEPDHVPGELSNESRVPVGNHVVIALSTGGFLVIAHLRDGSVRAREGESIAEGAPIGACGNSGNTSEPHVHIHVQRQDPRGRPIHFSEGLPLFFRDHDGAPMPLGGIDVVDGRAIATGAVIRHVGHVGSPATAATLR
jgi:hypothetical protein